eukprot:SAG31_NODE_1158_length_9605_cov_2.788555_16_plen_123_part_00
MTYADPANATAFAVVVETGLARCNHCGANNAATAASNTTQMLVIDLGSAELSSLTELAVWRTSDSSYFEAQAPVKVQGNSATLQIDPNAIYTITSTSGQQKGAFPHDPVLYCSLCSLHRVCA